MTQIVIDSKLQEVLFIRELDIKTKTPLSSNKVTTSMINYITLAQDMYIKKTLGSPLFENFRAEWIQSRFNYTSLPDGTYIDPISTPNAIPPIIPGDTTNYKQLFLEIQSTLIWYSYVLALPHIAIRVEEAGVMLNSTDYSESSGIVGLDRLVREGKAVAQVYMEQLQEYICENFKSEETEGSTDVGGASIGIFVPRRNHHRNNYNCNC